MKIAHIVCTFPPLQSGIGNVSYHFARQNALLGHDVLVFTPFYRELRKTLLERKPLENMSVSRLRPLMAYGNGAFLPQLLWKLGCFDCIMLHYPFYGGAEITYLSCMLRRFRGRLIVHYHMDVEGLSPVARVLSIPGRIVRSRLLGRADAIICASIDYIRNSPVSVLDKKHAHKMMEIPFGVDSHRFSPCREDTAPKRRGEKTILFVGGLDRAHYFKGVDNLLQAVAGLPKAAGPWRLNIVGEGNMRQQYEHLAESLGIVEHVTFFGTVTDEELPSCYKEADLLVLPSINSNEAFGLVLLEAMASGLPVIASNLPGVRRVFRNREEGYQIEPGNIQDLRDKIALILTDESLRQAMGKRARRLVEERYSWSMVGNKLEKVVNS